MSCPLASTGCRGCAGASRRQFLGTLAGVPLALASAGARSARAAEPARQQPVRVPLKVQPVLVCSLSKRREARSWRPWGGLHTETDVAAEKERIGRELAAMARQADFPLELLPLAEARNAAEAEAVARGSYDVTIMFAASGPLAALEALARAHRWNLMFVRHRSGPVYLWYEIAHPRFLRKTVDHYGQQNMDVDDVVVDSYAELLWRLRALGGLKNALRKRIVAVGGPSGWGAGGKLAPQRSREVFQLDIVTVPYNDLGERIKRARADDALVRRAHAAAEEYLRQKGVRLETDRKFVLNAFVLNEVFHDLLDEARTDAITINECMGTIMPLAETTACMPLSVLNDAGYMAFCESDFVVIPSGILLHYISGKPVFLNDPTWPHDGVVTIAHCTAPRKMDGKTPEPVRILTHFESDYGAAPKVEMRKGAAVTNLIPDFGFRHWLGFGGQIVDVPFLDICRSQVDVSVKGDLERLVREMRGFHWMTCYGEYLKETGYALAKLGIQWTNISA